MQVTAQFPYPGSIGMLDGQPVRIHQRIGADRVLVFGDGITRNAELSELSPPPESSLFRQWLDACVVEVKDYDCFTPAAEAADHYRAWLKAGGHEDAAPPSDYIFTRMMHEAGHHPTRGLWRAPFDTQARTRILYRFVLRPVREAV